MLLDSLHTARLSLGGMVRLVGAVRECCGQGFPYGKSPINIEEYRKRSMSPTDFKMGGALSAAISTSSSTAAGLRNPQLRTPLAGVPVRGAAMHRALGR